MSQMDTRGSGPPGTRWCALCRTEYVAGVIECADCLVTLVDAPPLTPEEVGDEDGDQLAYELDDVSAEERYFDEHGDLVVFATDEARVDELIDAVDHPDQLEAVDDGAHALDAVETLGALFVAADRLKNDPTDSEGTIAAADAARAMAEMPLPFGFAPPLWDELVERAGELRRLLETEAEVVDDDAVVDVATRLRSALRPYV
jgi:hypothetical protein